MISPNQYFFRWLSLIHDFFLQFTIFLVGLNIFQNQCPYFKAANRLYQNHKKTPQNKNPSNRRYNQPRRNINAIDDTEQHNDPDSDSDVEDQAQGN